VRVLVLSGSGLSADSGLPTFRGAGGLYQGSQAEEFLSADGYARDPEAVETWLEELRAREARALPNRAHVALAQYQARYPDEVLLYTQNVDTLLERAGARDVIHLHGRLDQLRCLGHLHTLRLESGTRANAASRCPRCASRLRSDVVLFGEAAPAYQGLWSALRRTGLADALVVIGTQGNVLPINDIVRAFRGLKLLNNLHPSEWIDAGNFDQVFDAPAASAIHDIVKALEDWRATANVRDHT
jgi:NAD-dependent deacetylase